MQPGTKTPLLAILLLWLVTASCAVRPSQTELASGARFKRSDDRSPLETVVEQQAALIQTLQAKVTALETDTAALKSRQQALSSPVAFSVRFKTDPPDTGILLSTHSTLKFDDIITNIGNGYNPQTGIFTAPVGGVYGFFLTLMSVNQHPPTFLSINKHGVVLDEVFAEGSLDNYDQGSTQVTTHLQAGEQVWVRQESGNSVRGGSWTVFTSYLLQAD